METDAIGLLTVLLGMAVFFMPPGNSFIIMVCTTVFGAAAAVKLSALGGASVLVANMFLVFFGIRIFMAYGEGALFAPFRAPRAGFYLLLLLLFGLVTAVFYPYLFHGDVQTMTVERTAGARSIISMSPLKFSSNNITQSVYALGGVICFAVTFCYFRQSRNLGIFVSAMLGVGALDVLFAILDILTYFTHTEYLLGLVRNANYAMLTGSEKGGLKRISGTFPEASAFAEFTVVLFAVTATLWLARIRPRLTGPLAMVQFVFLLISTSATGLVGLAIVSPILFLQSFFLSMRDPRLGRSMALPALVLATAFVALAVIVLLPGVADVIGDFLNEMIFSKSDSQSGKERAAWNFVAYQAFLDTYGIGAGLGSARASSFILVLLSNIGIPGTVLFFIFVLAIFRAKVDAGEQEDAGFRKALVRAAKNGVFACLLTAFVSGTGYDLGLLFYILAGFVASETVPRSATGKSPLSEREPGTPATLALNYNVLADRLR